MDLYINGRFARRRVTGVERYAGETSRALGRRSRLVVSPAYARGVLGHLWEQIVLPRRVPAGGILWSPANTGPLAAKRQILTVHDLAPFDHPEWYRRTFAWWYRWLLPRLWRRVWAIVAVSDFTRRRLLAWGVPESKIFVACPGVSPRFRPVPEAGRLDIRRRYRLPERYVLCVGTLEPRKNLDRLWKAWERVSSSFSGIGLVCVGARGPVFRPVSQGSVPPGGMLLEDVPEDDLVLIYAAAEIFVLASLYEGFGLTALEAMACGVPCLASASGGIPEAVGQAALMFDPLDVDALEAVLRRLLGDRSLREELRARGLERARAFRWEDTADKLWSICTMVEG